MIDALSLPPRSPVLRGLSRRWTAVARRAQFCVTRLIYHAHRGSPPVLGACALDVLQRRYPFRTAYRYDAEAVRRRGAARASEILALPGASRSTVFLEVACSDGMVSAMLQRSGKRVLAVDRRRDHLDSRAAEAGISFLAADAEELPLVANSIDYIFSYNAFEHFAHPDRVLLELTRIVRRGGWIFLKFGPLYCSPWGEHAYRTITVPYCQYLFPRGVMNEYALQHGLRPLDRAHVNGWSLGQYRQMWRDFSGVLEPVVYEERRDLSGLEIIRRYPSCFRSQPLPFEAFLISHITAVFMRR